MAANFPRNFLNKSPWDDDFLFRGLKCLASLAESGGKKFTKRKDILANRRESLDED